MYPATSPVPGSTVPPVDHAAHRSLVAALLRAGEPAGDGPSYALLWQFAATEQQRAGRAPHDIERSLELLVTEILALSHTAEWFGTRPRLAAAATEETIAYWTGSTGVSSHAAHLAWHECWESRARMTRRVPLVASDVATAVAAETRLRVEWEQRWQTWAEQSTAVVTG